MRLYKYRGQIDGWRASGLDMRQEIRLYDPKNEDKPPVLLYVDNGLATYLDKVVGSDLEEKYIETDYFYDELLFLRRIEIPSNDPRIPAKIIAQAEIWDKAIAVFGSKEYIDISPAEPMCEEEWCRWLDWQHENDAAGRESSWYEDRLIGMGDVARSFQEPGTNNRKDRLVFNINQIRSRLIDESDESLLPLYVEAEKMAELLKEAIEG